MLKWIKGIKLATIAQRAWNIAMNLNPIGLIVTALVLAGLAIWKFRDEIKDGFGQVVQFAQDLYIGVKTWLTDKLGAIFDGVKAKVDAVTGFFRNMKDKIVGNSIVPDMVNGIGNEFQRMGGLMSTETTLATGCVAGIFSTFVATDLPSIISPANITSIFTSAFTGAGGALGALKAIGTQLAGSFAKHFLTPFSSALSSGLAGIFGGGGAAAVAGVGGASSAAGAAGAAGGIGGIGAIGGVLGAIPVWGWVALGGLAAFAFFKGWGGPSKAEQEARATFAGFHKGVVDALGGTQRYADAVQTAIANGWDRTLAETAIAFILMTARDMPDSRQTTRRLPITSATRTPLALATPSLWHVLRRNTPSGAQMAAETASANTKASEESTADIVHDAAEIGKQFKGLSVDEAAQLGAALTRSRREGELCVYANPRQRACQRGHAR